VVRYLSILALWSVCWYLPQMAGEWYSLHFSIYQSLISLFLLVTVLKLTKDWWRGEYATLCVLQIFLNIGDFFLNFSPQSYGIILTSLNWLELFVILGCGGFTQLYRFLHGRDPSRNNSGGGPDGSAFCAPSRGRNA